MSESKASRSCNQKQDSLGNGPAKHKFMSPLILDITSSVMTMSPSLLLEPKDLKFVCIWCDDKAVIVCLCI